jgi:hypothetical protein
MLFVCIIIPETHKLDKTPEREMMRDSWTGRLMGVGRE